MASSVFIFHDHCGLPLQVYYLYQKMHGNVNVLHNLTWQSVHLQQHITSTYSKWWGGERLENCNSMSQDIYQLKFSHICIPNNGAPPHRSVAGQLLPNEKAIKRHVTPSYALFCLQHTHTHTLAFKSVSNENTKWRPNCLHKPIILHDKKSMERWTKPKLSYHSWFTSLHRPKMHV